MQQARIELLQRMPIFGGVRANIIQFLLDVCPIEIGTNDEFFCREGDQADSMFVLEAGTADVLESGTDRTASSNPQAGRLLRRDGSNWTSVRAAPPSAPPKTAPRSASQPPTSTTSIRRISNSSR